MFHFGTACSVGSQLCWRTWHFCLPSECFLFHRKFITPLEKQATSNSHSTFHRVLPCPRFTHHWSCKLSCLLIPTPKSIISPSRLPLSTIVALMEYMFIGSNRECAFDSLDLLQPDFPPPAFLALPCPLVLSLSSPAPLSAPLSCGSLALLTSGFPGLTDREAPSCVERN
jgi:hypothetical protein